MNTSIKTGGKKYEIFEKVTKCQSQWKEISDNIDTDQVHRNV